MLLTFCIKKRLQGYSNVAKMSYQGVIYSNKRSSMAETLALMEDQYESADWPTARPCCHWLVSYVIVGEIATEMYYWIRKLRFG